MRRALLLLILPMAALPVSGCSGSHHSLGPSPLRALSKAEDLMIATVLASRQGQGYGFFPKHSGHARCVIHGGGPFPGLRIKGACSTQVTFPPGHGGQAKVLFTETWPRQEFHYTSSPQRAQQHSWRFIVLATRKVIPDGQSGDFPPQYVR
jgi:hypothetical protein